MTDTEQPKTPEVTPEKPLVWVKCRARENCVGNQATIISEIKSKPTGSYGSFIPEMGGKLVRYRCATCEGIFQIKT